MAHSIADFIAKHQLTMEADPAERNPNMTDMPAGSSHWRCNLTYGADDESRSMSVVYSMGPALKSPPRLDEVLDTLALDSSGYEGSMDVAEWAAEYGISDLQEARQGYRQVEQQAFDLKQLLGGAAYEELLWETELL